MHICVPWQVLRSLFNIYPSLQEHSKLPGLLVHLCWHGDGDAVHSSISVDIHIILADNKEKQFLVNTKNSSSATDNYRCKKLTVANTIMLDYDMHSMLWSFVINEAFKKIQ